MSEIKEVTVNELTDVLTNIEVIKGMGAIAHIEQFTTPKTTKKDRQTKEAFNGEIKKHSVLSIILNTEYEKVITNQLQREDKPESDYHRGRNTMPLDKTISKNNFFGLFNNKPVLEYKPNQGQTPKVKYFLNGVETPKNQLPDVLPVKSKATNQGTEKEIFWRKLYLDNLLSITIFGTKYIIKKE